ncbi:MAG TPA: hypothetical protein PLL10_08450, partial [Elusimicrobiales bacterium]|nr:hypothetical protein [Elusimicrobiales bacterium]
MKRIIAAVVLTLGASQVLAADAKLSKLDGMTDVRPIAMSNAVPSNKIVCKPATLNPFYSSVVKSGAITLEKEGEATINLVNAITLNVENVGA